MMAIQMSSLGFSPLLPAIQKDFSLSYSQIGLFTGLYGLVAMAVSVPAGILAKRVGEKRALAGGLLGVALGLLLLSQASTYRWALGRSRGLAARISSGVRLRDGIHRIGFAARISQQGDGHSGRDGIARIGDRRAVRHHHRGALSDGAAASSVSRSWRCWARPFSGSATSPARAAARSLLHGHGPVIAEQKRIPHAGGVEHGFAGADQHGRIQRDVLCAVGGEDDLSSWRDGERVCDQHQLRCRDLRERSVRLPVRQV